MLKIRDSQLRAFFLALGGPFTARAIAHVNKAFPERCRELGEEGVRASIDVCQERGWRYGLEDDDELMHYLEVMYTLGFDFDEDPRYPWAREILCDAALGPETRAELLIQQMEQERGAPGA
jgi:hypothetical protein